jgi:hypothetical protein
MSPVPQHENRRALRNKVTQVVRVRPSSFVRETFDDLARTLNASRNGIYFKAWRRTYYPDMRLYVTYPYDTSPTAINKEFMARVVRIDPLPDGRSGIAVELLNSLGLQAN